MIHKIYLFQLFSGNDVHMQILYMSVLLVFGYLHIFDE